jgi:hypothetical protein
MKDFWLGFTAMNVTIQMIIIFLVLALVLYLIKKGIVDLILKKYFGKTETKTGLLAHETCQHFPSLVGLMQEAMYKNIQIYSIKTGETIYDQINVFENTFDHIFKIMKSNYLSLYKTEKKIKSDGILNEIQVKYYISILRGSFNSMKNLAKKFMKENHFIEKTPIEFKLYKKERIADFQMAMSEYLDDEYDSAIFDISREKLYSANMLCADKINDEYDRFFDRALDISKASQKKIKKLESEIKDFV